MDIINREKAWQKYEVARYLLRNTYPSIKDPKLLITILSNIHDSLDQAMAYLIGPQLSFREKIAYLQRKGFKTNFIEELHEILESHKNSPIEFSRQDKYVICNDRYGLRFLTEAKMKEFLEQNKSMLEEIDQFSTKVSQRKV